MKISTWNVNSVKARKERLAAFLQREAPDVLCLQELKAVDEEFPHDVLEGTDYEVATHGQKTYNGVAILSRRGLEDVRVGMGDEVDDPQARLISARIQGVRVLSAYVPNGSEPDSDKYSYKLAWLQRLKSLLAKLIENEKHVVLCGDLNIAPSPIDVARPDQWEGTVLCLPAVRDAFQQLLALGLEDAFRAKAPEEGLYSWWDYRALGFPKNNGLRIDHILATPELTARCEEARVDRDERKGKRPSDHAPVICRFSEL